MRVLVWALAAASLFLFTACSDAAPAPRRASSSTAIEGASLPAVPLSTQGRWIVDANGARFKLASVNWYGAESPDHVVAGLDRAALGDLAASIREMGFNSVRIPWSNELLEADPSVDDALLAANPDLAGKTGMQVLDAVIDALAAQGLVVILSNHVSRADWCCSDDDGNGLWYTDDYPESSWIADWRAIVRRYAAQPAVVGADLRNEPRSANGKGATWGGDPSTDWAAAAERGGNAVLEENPSLLVVVEGIHYALDLRGVYDRPVHLSAQNKLVYSAHDYGYDHPSAVLSTYAVLHEWLGRAWGYIVTQDRAFTAPVWVGEIGTCHGAVADCMDGTTSDQGRWFNNLRRYLAEADFDWSYWALNGTQATGAGRAWGAEETYGILDTTWGAPASTELLSRLQSLQAPTQGP